MFPVVYTKRMTAWLLIFVQLFMPVASMTPLLGYAATSPGMQGTVQGHNVLIMSESEGKPHPSQASSAASDKPVKTPYYTSPRSLLIDHSKAGHSTPFVRGAKELPDLSLSADEKAGVAAKPHNADTVRENGTSDSLASGAMQAGSLLSSENATDASINYAKGVGERLINQQINDWLKQFGNAKVSLGSDKKASGDMLIPLYDAERDLLFT